MQSKLAGTLLSYFQRAKNVLYYVGGNLMVAQQPTVEKVTEILNWICEG